MKLTNYIRDAYVERALQDVPKAKDFENLIRDAALAAFVAKLPANVSRIWKDGTTRGYINTVQFNDFGVSLYVPGIGGRYEHFNGEILTKEERDTLAGIRAAWKADEAMRRDLKNKLRAAAYGCTTRKALAELLPEFAHYLPAEDAPAGRSLPVVANLVTDFVKAGWPKDKAGKKVKEAAHG